jgi:hypothetical protein
MDLAGKIKLTQDVPLQTRRAQALPAPLADAIHAVCRARTEISACYVLDVRKPETEEVGLIIAVTVDDEVRNLDEVAQAFQIALHDFPEQAHKTFIMSAVTFLPQHEGAIFYARTRRPTI